jgi:GTP-binding protein HflX
LPHFDFETTTRRRAFVAQGREQTGAVVIVPVRSDLAARSDASPVKGATTGRPHCFEDHSLADRIAETVGLARAIDLDVRAAEAVRLGRPRPATLFGPGKMEALRALIADREATLAIIDHPVSPVQQRNLENAWRCKVLDRIGLILEIFGERALTREGRLQVELAHLLYQKGRLVRSWTHLERQRGGAGFLGGPGETQIETDRRLIQERIDAIRKELEVVTKTRELHRAGRRRVPYPLVAIVGYTNAGKSTLFNRLTGASVLTMDQVFATLDPAMREVKLPSGRRIILSDTVGFISNLPPTLVAAFRATLEEVVEADLVLHVRDISHPESEAQRRDVDSVLAQLGLKNGTEPGNVVEVANKIDLLSPPERAAAARAAHRAGRRFLPVSAETGEGIESLLTAIDAWLGQDDEILTLEIPAREGGLLSWLHTNAQVLSQEAAESGNVTCRLRIDPAAKGKLEGRLKRAGLPVPQAAPFRV